MKPIYPWKTMKVGEFFTFRKVTPGTGRALASRQNEALFPKRFKTRRIKDRSICERIK